MNQAAKPEQQPYTPAVAPQSPPSQPQAPPVQTQAPEGFSAEQFYFILLQNMAAYSQRNLVTPEFIESYLKIVSKVFGESVDPTAEERILEIDGRLAALEREKSIKSAFSGGRNNSRPNT